MRPVIRGDVPTDSNGIAISFSDYAYARKDLIARLGEYCSYCEMQLDASLAVEHVKPKQPRGAQTVDLALALDWYNFLLACTNCNSTKGDKPIIVEEYLWPDQDNTFRALVYTEGGRINCHETLEIERAQRLVSLVGLDKEPDTATASDRRWLNRREAWDMAEQAKARLARCQIPEMMEQIIDTIKAKGYWSIWMTVFNDQPNMLQRIINAHPGTDEGCFDVPSYAAISRTGGKC